MQRNKTYSTIALAKSAMERIPLHSWGNGIFYSISRDHKQPMKRSEFNKVLYKYKKYVRDSYKIYTVGNAARNT